MCLGIPYEVLDVLDRDTCRIRIGTGAQACFTGLVDPVAPGDWLLVHAGFALRRIDPADARANLELIRRALEASELPMPEAADEEPAEKDP
ncbi:MAG: HypC/HybG/HupF family hydrogenase formation chaperone [Deinococcales bacterium]|jgi:hydrogenase expression/formation protein HypC